MENTLLLSSIYPLEGGNGGCLGYATQTSFRLTTYWFIVSGKCSVQIFADTGIGPLDSSLSQVMVEYTLDKFPVYHRA